MPSRWIFSEESATEKEKNEFFEAYKDKRWLMMRAKINRRANYQCEVCGNGYANLEVHHSYYEKDLKPWEYPESSLHCLCPECHDDADALRVVLKRRIGAASIESQEMVLGFVAGCWSRIDSKTEIEILKSATRNVYSEAYFVGLATGAGFGSRGEDFYLLCRELAYRGYTKMTTEVLEKMREKANVDELLKEFPKLS